MLVDVLDTETASLKGGVCDIAIVRIDENFEVLWQAESLIDPECPIEPSASGIHHITDDMVYASPTLAEFMHQHDHPLDRENLTVAGHNVQFDCRMLAAVLPPTYRKLCTLRLARTLWPDNENHKLQTLRYQFKLDAGTAHRAMGDVLACVNLLRLMAEARDITLAELVELSRVPLSQDSKISFGKHKGSRLRDIPIGWVKWLLAQDQVDPDLREALAPRLN